MGDFWTGLPARAPEDLGGSRDEAAVVVDSAQEGLQLLDSCRRLHLLDGHHMAGERKKAGRGDTVAKEVHLGDGEDTFLHVDIEAIGCEDLQNLGHVLGVLLGCAAGNEDVVHIDKDIGKAAHEAVHQPLEGLGGDLQSKGHGDILEEAERCDHCRPGDVCGHHWHLVVILLQIQVGEDGAAPHMVVAVLHIGERVPTLGCLHIEAAVVAAGAPSTILFPNHMERRQPGAVGPANNSCLFESGELLLGML